MMSPIWKRNDGTYEIENNGRYHATETSMVTISMVETYLIEHPEALIPEPVPPEPTQEELDAREVQALLSYLESNSWYASRKTMTGKDIPEDVLVKCQEVRERISELRGQA